MTERKRPNLKLEAEDAADPEVGRCLAAMTNTRKRTLAALRNLPDSALDALAPPERNSIGTVLYHVALIEADWLLDEITGTAERDWPKDLFGVEHRDEDGVLSVLSGETLEQHLARLERVREMLVAVIRPMEFEDFHTARERSDYDVTPAWVLHHLMQHEAEHRSQISGIRERLDG